MNYKLDNDKQVFFYEQDFYVLSNFSAFRLYWAGHLFGTSEEAYQWEKFPDDPQSRFLILNAPSAHVAFKLAEERKALRRPHWDAIKVDIAMLTSGRNHYCENRQAYTPVWLSNLLGQVL